MRTLRCMLFLKSSPNPNECMHERSESALTVHAHTRVVEIPKKGGHLILNEIRWDSSLKPSAD